MADRQQQVVAGYDGSHESQAGVAWAAAVAHRRGLPLVVLSATGVDASNPAVYRAGVAAGTRQRAQTLAEEGAALARGAADIEVEAVGVEQGAVAALVEQSENAALVVTGNRGRGRLRGALLGSAAFSVAIHAKCPVAIVRGSLRPLPSPDYPIVVGTDGSPSSAAAVLEAARLAAETEAMLRIVVAYDGPDGANSLVARYPGDVQAGAEPWGHRDYDPDLDGTSTEQRRQEAAGIARDAAQRASEAHPGVAIELAVMSGRPERAIIDAAHDASLIVVGARGRGDFASLLLGSVSRDVIQHADCAVYVVR